MIVIATDPGKSSGAAVIGYDEAGVWLVSSHQVSGGVGGFRSLLDGLQEAWEDNNPTWISEKFSPRPGSFGQSLDSTLPLVCEGVLIDRGLLPEYTPGGDRWVQPAQQYIAGGTGKADKKKRQHRMLKDLGFYRTGKDLGSPDADDFRSSCAHALSYLIRTGHKPTYGMISDWNERNA